MIFLWHAVVFVCLHVLESLIFVCLLLPAVILLVAGACCDIFVSAAACCGICVFARA